MLTESRSEKDTYAAGYALGKKLGGGSVVLLSGFLGVGKTVFAKGIAAALGIAEEVLSPTFTLLREYKTSGGLMLYHIDAYRIKDAQEAVEAGLAECIGAKNAVTLVEWHENITDLFKEHKTIVVEIQPVKNDSDKREITIHE